MLRKLLKVTLAGTIGMLALVLAQGAGIRAEDKKDEKVPTISEIMKKGHAKTDGYMAKISEAAKGAKWDAAQEYAKTLEVFGENLGKNKAPKGDAKSWEKLSKKYAENTKAVHKATEDKDAKAVGTALGMIGKSCGECHGPHKP